MNSSPIYPISHYYLRGSLFNMNYNYSRQLAISETSDSGVITYNIFMSLICITCASIACGLTQGLLSLNPLEMKIKARSGTDEVKEQACRVIPLIRHHHLLLVTLMLFNATANEALPLFLDQIVPSWLTIIISVTLVLCFGEIVPSAVFTGPKQLKIASNLAPFTWSLIFILYPIAYPISYLLDKWLGHDDGMTIFNRSEIVTMMRIQQEEGPKRGISTRDTVQKDEVVIIGGALRLRDLTTVSVMSTDLFMLSIDEKLTIQTLSKIFNSGFSRIPIYDGSPNDIVGILLVKDLLFVDADDEVPIRNFMSLFGRPIQTVWPDQKLKEVLKLFRKSHVHIAIVKDVNNTTAGDPFYEVKGIITMEDIFEALIGEEIIDETDIEDERYMKLKGMNRNIDFAKMKLIASNLAIESRLSNDEIGQIKGFLLNEIPNINTLVKSLDEIINESQYIVVTSDSNYNMKYLYEKGKKANVCTLILEGDVKVIKDDKEMIVGPWTLLGDKSLLVNDGEEVYISDITAFNTSTNFRCLRINRPNFKYQQNIIEKSKRISKIANEKVIIHPNMSDFNKVSIENYQPSSIPKQINKSAFLKLKSNDSSSDSNNEETILNPLQKIVDNSDFDFE